MTNMTSTIFHVDLSDADPNEQYCIAVGDQTHALSLHTEDSRATLRASRHGGGHHRVTHFTPQPVSIHADQVVRVHVRHTLKARAGASAEWGVTHSAIHVPPPPPLPPHPRAGLGPVAAQHHGCIDYVSTAKSLVFHHPDLITKDRELASIIFAYMDEDKTIAAMFEEVAMLMRQLGPPSETEGWARLVPFTPEANPATGMDGKTTYYLQQPTDEVIRACGPVMTAMMRATKNDLRLQGKKWTLQEGTAVQTTQGPTRPTRAAGIHWDGDDWRVAMANTTPVSGLRISAKVAYASLRSLTLTFENLYIRYLGAYIRFYDAQGQVMKLPQWKVDDNDNAELVTGILGNQYDDLRYLGHIGPVNNVFAVPITSDPGRLQVTVTMPPGAVRADVFGCGLGTGENTWPKAPLVGGAMTGIFNLGIPAFMLGFQVAAQSYQPLYKIVHELMEDRKFLTTVILLGGSYYSDQFETARQHGEMDWKAFSSLSTLLFKAAASKLLLWVVGQTAAQKAAEQIPFAGWIMVAINVATGIAQMAQTIVEVATSPWNIRNTVASSITTRVTLGPDPRHRAFPQGLPGEEISATVKMIYRDEKRPTLSQRQVLAAGSTAKTLAAAFPDNTLGGQVKFEADFYIGHWLAGKATTGWLNNDAERCAHVAMVLVEFPKPLSAQSVYRHAALLTYRNGAYAWQQTDRAPTSTLADRDTRSQGHAISEWAGITLSQKLGKIGFAWKAAGLGIPSCTSGHGGQLFAMLNVSIPGIEPIDANFPTCAFDGPTQLIYDPFPPKFLQDDKGQWQLDAAGHALPDPAELRLGNYFVDPRKANVALSEGGGYHLRQVELRGDGPIELKQPLSWGRFAFFPDSFALHPSGHLIAVSTRICKIQIAQPGQKGLPDHQVPVARTYAGEALLRDRRGLLFRPIAVACAYDGTILILEDSKSSIGQAHQIVSRIQAFDLQGNPVNRFVDNKGQPSPFLPIAQASDITYLDLAVVGDEQLTSMYVLFYRGAGTRPDDYHMAIYQYGAAAPTKNPLVTTDRIAAARLVVDMWHTVYTLNFEPVTDGHGKPAGPHAAATPAAVRTVPSISEWLPPVPQGQ